MTETITLSLSNQDKMELEQNPFISPSKLFRSAMVLERAKSEFMDINDIVDYKLKIKDLMDKISFMSREIERRNERIDSLQDVLAQREIQERRVRNSIKENSITGISPVENIISN
jgi:Na+/phosphate symporter